VEPTAGVDGSRKIIQILRSEAPRFPVKRTAPRAHGGACADEVLRGGTWCGKGVAPFE
jgi:hypothetical protein